MSACRFLIHKVLIRGCLLYIKSIIRCYQKREFSKSLNPRSLEGGGGVNPSIFLALNFCSLTDCQKLWHNCSLFVNTLIKWRHRWRLHRKKSRNFSLETYKILTTSQWIRSISWISTAKWCFPVNLRHKSENLNKIWKFENPRWRPPLTSFIWLLLPWKPIRHQVVLLNWKYKWSLLCVPNFKSIGRIVSKVEGGGASWVKILFHFLFLLVKCITPLV